MRFLYCLGVIFFGACHLGAAVSAVDGSTRATLRNSLTAMLVAADDDTLCGLSAAVIVVSEGRGEEEAAKMLDGLDAAGVIALARECDAIMFDELKREFAAADVGRLREQIAARPEEVEPEVVEGLREERLPALVLDAASAEALEESVFLALQLLDGENVRDFLAAVDLLEGDGLEVFDGVDVVSVVELARERDAAGFAVARGRLDEFTVDELCRDRQPGVVRLRLGDVSNFEASVRGVVRTLGDGEVADFAAAFVLAGEEGLEEWDGSTAGELIAGMRERSAERFGVLRALLGELPPADLRRLILE